MKWSQFLASDSLSGFQTFVWFSFTVLALNTYTVAARKPRPCKCFNETLVCRGIQKFDPKNTCGSDTLKVLKIDGHHTDSLFLPSPCSLQEFYAAFSNLKSIKELESCQEIQRLDVSNNKFLEVTRHTFPQLPQLRYLVIGFLDLQNIPSDVLQYFPKLIELDLTGNRLTSISKDDFASLPNLRSLKLSQKDLSAFLVESDKLSALNHQTNCQEGLLSTIKNIEVLLFSGNKLSSSCWDEISEMTQLKKLDLSSNQICSLPPKRFSKITLLEWLSLEYNEINILEPGIFDELTELKELRLSRNKFRSISNVLLKLHKLEVLILECNPINELPNGIFNGLNKLKILNLKETAITELSSGIFSDLQSLEEIDLSETKIKYLSSDVFEGLNSLKRISINYIGLAELPQGLLNRLHELQHFEAASNKLQNIIPGYFRDQKHLIRLDLASNRISQLPDDAFSALQSLKWLVLSFNPLREFPDAVKNLHSLELLFMVQCDVSAIPTYNSTMWPNLKNFYLQWRNKDKTQVPEETVLRSWLEPPLNGTRELHLANCVTPPSALRWADDDPTINVRTYGSHTVGLLRGDDQARAQVVLRNVRDQCLR